MRRRRRRSRYATLLLDARTALWLGRCLLRPALAETLHRRRQR